eukprot:171313-Amphidinium_carterae.1
MEESNDNSLFSMHSGVGNCNVHIAGWDRKQYYGSVVTLFQWALNCFVRRGVLNMKSGVFISCQ